VSITKILILNLLEKAEILYLLQYVFIYEIR